MCIRSSSSSTSSSASASQKQPPCRGRRGRHFWNVPDGPQRCPGADGQSCEFALDGSGGAGVADETGKCVFCNPDRLRAVHRANNGRLLTHLLVALPEALLKTALSRVERHIDRATAKDWKHRVKRCKTRRNPERARRGPRGKYKRREPDRIRDDGGRGKKIYANKKKSKKTGKSTPAKETAREGTPSAQGSRRRRDAANSWGVQKPCRS